jgi:hypothetical protein
VLQETNFLTQITICRDKAEFIDKVLDEFVDGLPLLPLGLAPMVDNVAMTVDIGLRHSPESPSPEHSAPIAVRRLCTYTEILLHQFLMFVQEHARNSKLETFFVEMRPYSGKPAFRDIHHRITNMLRFLDMTSVDNVGIQDTTETGQTQSSVSGEAKAAMCSIGQRGDLHD